VQPNVENDQVPVYQVRPARGWSLPDLKEVWEYRELLYFFAWRDVKVRYKQTVIGGVWAVLQPFFTMVVFTIFFGTLANIPSEGVPYPIFSFAALVPWTYFSNSITNATTSIVSNRTMITKVYFPRVIIPIASVLTGLVDLVISFVVLCGMMVFYRVSPTSSLLFLPLLVVLMVFTSLAVGLWFSALNVVYRDVSYLVPFLMQIWLFASPVVYPSSMVPEKWRAIYGLNPMAGVIEGFRLGLLGTGTGLGPLFIVSTLAVLVLLVGGLAFFRRMERKFVDVV